MDAIIGIGACEPRVIMKTFHATLEEAARIARDIGTARGQGGWH
jgi:hypothetical protein